MTFPISMKALVVVLGAALLVPAAPQPAAAAAASGIGACTNGWQELFVPDGSFSDIPQGSIVREGKLDWVVGGGHRGPMALKWTGSRLVARQTGSTLRRGLADGVARGNGLWVVGGYQRPSWGAEIWPLLGRWVDNVFRNEPVRIDRRLNAAVADLVALPDGGGFAVGSYLEEGFWKALVLKRKNGRWVRDDPFAKGGSGLLGITRTPGGSVWAAGWRNEQGTMRPLLLKNVKGRWKRVSTGPVPAGPAVLTDIDIPRDGRGWAIGYMAKGNGAKHTPLILSWNGQRWKREALPWVGASAIPQSLDAAANGELWMAGTQLATDARETRGFVAHRQAGRWTMRYVDTPPDVRSSLQSVDATSAGAVVTGTVGFTALVLRSCDLPSPDVASGDA